MDNIRVAKEDIMLLSENKMLVLTEREKMLADMAYKRGFNDGYNKRREEENKHQEKIKKEANNSR
jgi:hypothetical protein